MHAPPRGRRARLAACAVASLSTALGLVGAGAATTPATATAAATPAATAPDDRAPKPPSPRSDLDVLFVGAHPDDEAFRLSTYGQWNEDFGTETGVLTITRGEGGGNAVGPEEGPALGRIREAEERRAVSRAGISDVYNLDEVDFYYTVSAPLTEDVWGEQDTLAKVVRVIRSTQPEVVVTMDPAPSPGNHGNHQYAALMALQAYRLAGDPRAFPGQIIREGLQPWSVERIFLNSARGTATGTGSSCPTSFTPERPTQNVYGVWAGARSQRYGMTWAQVEREAQREYASQGWSVFPDVPTDPQEIGCDYFVQIDARVPYPRGDLGAGAAGPGAMLEGALLQEPGGLPLGTGLETDVSSVPVVPGGSTEVTVRVTAPPDRALASARLRLRVPEGWSGGRTVALGTVAPGRTRTRTFPVRAGDDAETNARQLVSAVLRSGGRAGYSDVEVEVAPPVRGEQELLSRVSTFQEWARANGYPQMEGFVKPVLTLPSGGSREVEVVVTNFSAQPQSGGVTLELPEGFAAEPASRAYADLAPGATTRVSFTVTNTDAGLPTSNEGGAGGDYDYAIVTTDSTGSSSTTRPALELVPATTVPAVATAPQVDGVVSREEYPGQPIDLSRVWEGSPCESAADCSATGWVSRHGDDLYVAVDVTDDVLGTRLAASDCKRHWRTDSVEIAIDPAGTSENTSTTFKTAVLPVTQGSDDPCYLRDADAHQGPGEQTAPGVEVASTVGEDYDGYVVEVKIPATELPGTVDPDHLGLNVLVYDSDTQDKTGQTRIGWSTWGGVQGDPYRWGVATLPGWTPPQVPAATSVIPSVALRSVNSPQSIAQAVRTGVPLAGKRAAWRWSTAWLSGRPEVRGDRVVAPVTVTGDGVAHVFVWRPADGVLASLKARLSPGDRRLVVPLEGADADGARLLMAYAASSGGTTSSARRLP